MAASIHALIALFLITDAKAAEIYVSNFNSGTIGQYDATTGATINGAFVSGLDSPIGLALSGGNLFVANQGGTIGKYDAVTGAPVNASLMSGLTMPIDVAVSGGNLFVTENDSPLGRIAKYTTSGTAVNTSFISGLNIPFGLAISDGRLFVSTLGNAFDDGTIGVYDAATGATINSALVTGVPNPRFIAVSGGHLFVSEDAGGGFISEFDAVTGAPINFFFITVNGGPRGIAFAGGNVLVADIEFNQIGQYSSSGALINGTFVSESQGLDGPEDIVVSGAVPDSAPGFVAFARGCCGNALRPQSNNCVRARTHSKRRN